MDLLFCEEHLLLPLMVWVHFYHKREAPLQINAKFFWLIICVLGCGLFQEYSAPSIGCRGSWNSLMGIKIWKNNVPHMGWPSQSSNLNPFEYPWEILEWHSRQHFPPSSSKHQMSEHLLGEWCLSYLYSSSDLWNFCQCTMNIFWWLVVTQHLISILYVGFSFHFWPVCWYKHIVAVLAGINGLAGLSGKEYMFNIYSI